MAGGPGFDALVREAAAVQPGAERLPFLPHLAGERTPHLDPAARGGFLGSQSATADRNSRAR